MSEENFKKFFEYISNNKGEQTARSRRRKMIRALKKFNPYGNENEIQPDESGPNNESASTK